MTCQDNQPEIVRAVGLAHGVLLDMGLYDNALPQDTMERLVSADTRELALGIAYLAKVLFGLLTEIGADPFVWVAKAELAQAEFERGGE